MERANIAIKDYFPIPYLYLQLIIIHKLGVLIPFTPFEAKLIVVAKVIRIKLHPMSRALLGSSKSCSGGQRSNLLYGYFFAFYGILLTPIRGWVTLFGIPGKKMLKPHSSPYTIWKVRFVRVRGRDRASMVTTWMTIAPIFLYLE